ncbi:MAG: pilus motility taxis protein HmpF [Cyanobacteria bacterium P01_F01_bin.143]
MRYLAEIQKQSKGFMGGFDTKLKLLACQRNDRSWSVVPGNEFIETDDTGNLGDGALVIVNITNRQVQGKIETASKEMIVILQGFSRLLDKTKSQENEIEVWKESLTIQSEELSRREIEMENRLEQLEQMEEESEKFEEQRQEIAAARQEAEQIKTQFESKSQELEQAWEQLRGEQNLLEQKIRDSKLIDESQADEILALLDALKAETIPTESIQQKLQLAFKAIEEQQGFFDKYWQELSQKQNNVPKFQKECSRHKSELQQCQQNWETLTSSVAQTSQKLQTAKKSLEIKQDLIQVLEAQEQAQTEIEESFERMGIESSGASLDQQLDFKALENMPLPELEEMVANLQKDLEKVARFVSDQEEELSWQCKAVEELEQKINEASEFDRLSLEQELAEEKEAKKMLDKTLIGQRRSLKERHEVLLQHSRILKRRQGIIDLDSELQAINLEPIKNLVQQGKLKLNQKQSQIKEEIQQIQLEIEQLEAEVKQQQADTEDLRQEVEQKQDSWQQAKITLAKVQAKIDFYQKTLQPLQDILNNHRQDIEELEASVASDNQTEQSQNQVLTEIDRIIKELIMVPTGATN